MYENIKLRTFYNLQPILYEGIGICRGLTNGVNASVLHSVVTTEFEVKEITLKHRDATEKHKRTMQKYFGCPEIPFESKLVLLGGTDVSKIINILL